MEQQAKAKEDAAQLEKKLEALKKNGRFTVHDRVNHVRRLQKVDGVEVYAVQYTTVMRAAATDNVAGVLHFIEQGRLNDADEAGNSALHEACRFGFQNVVNTLCEHGIAVNAKNKMGQTSAHLAVAGGHTHLLEPLYDMGADLALTDNGGATPAHYAAQASSAR